MSGTEVGIHPRSVESVMLTALLFYLGILWREQDSDRKGIEPPKNFTRSESTEISLWFL